MPSSVPQTVRYSYLTLTGYARKRRVQCPVRTHVYMYIKRRSYGIVCNKRNSILEPSITPRIYGPTSDRCSSFGAPNRQCF